MLESLDVMLTAGALVATAVWGVARISSKLERLSERVDSLSRSIHDLASRHDTTDTRVENLTERVIKLEAHS